MKFETSERSTIDPLSLGPRETQKLSLDEQIKLILAKPLTKTYRT